MAGVKHAYQTALPDDAGSEVSSSEWNADHAIDDNSVAPAKLAVSATDRLIGRSTAGAGAAEEIPLTAAGRALLDDVDAAAQRTTLGAESAGAGAAAVTTHEGAADPHTGYRRESEDHTHASTGLQGGTVAHSALTGLATGDPHTQYQQESEKNAQNGYAGLDNDASARVPAARLATGTPDGTKFLRDDRTWQSVAVAQVSHSSAVAAAADYLARIKLAADTEYRLVIGLDSSDRPRILFGGGSAAGDVEIRRAGGDVDLLLPAQVNGIRVFHGSDTAARFRMGSAASGGELRFGSGSAVPDLSLRRSAAKTLGLDDQAGGPVTFAVNGTITADIGVPNLVRKSADQAISAIAFADSTGLTQAVVAGTYIFEFVVFFQTNAATVGIRLAVNGPAFTAGSLIYGAYNPATAPSGAGSAIAHGAATAYDTETIAITAGPGAVNTMAVLQGSVIFTAAGTLALRHGSETASSTTIKAGSWGRITRIA